MEVICPRCRASGIESLVPLEDDLGTCATCKTNWKRDELNQMIARK